MMNLHFGNMYGTRENFAKQKPRVHGLLMYILHG